MLWSELNKAEKDHYRSLVEDYWKETGLTSNRLDPPAVTKKDIQKYWKQASAYFNTDDQLEFKEE